MADRWDQHRISRDRAAIRALKLMLGFFAVDLAWEVIRANLDDLQRAGWPWRFTILDPSTCATLAALMAGILVTRSQYAQTTLPILSWSAFPGTSEFVQGSVRTIRLYNAGGGRATVRSIEYRFQEARTSGEPEAVPGPWLDWHNFVQSIDAIGLKRPDEIFVFHLGPGASIPLTTSTHDGIELFAFSQRALERLALLDVRIQAEDTLGDVHEKKLRCLRGGAADRGPASTHATPGRSSS